MGEAAKRNLSSLAVNFQNKVKGNPQFSRLDDQDREDAAERQKLVSHDREVRGHRTQPVEHNILGVTISTNI
jgi:hypothetical protein